MKRQPALPRLRQAWTAPEVVQTSAMDCGPAALKCVLDGHGIPVSYGRLREACQTDVDGTSIDALETVAPQLGLPAQQVMLPLNHVLGPGPTVWPAIVVVTLPDGAPHFVVVWRRVGPWLQVMDPASGRRWVKARDFAHQVLQHEHLVSDLAWRAWAATDAFTVPLTRGLQAIGLGRRGARALVEQAAEDAGWFSLGALDASLRMVQQLVRAGGLRQGRDAARLVKALHERTLGHADDIFRDIPATHWSVQPALGDSGEMALRLRGAVLLRLGAPLQREISYDATLPPPPALSRELQSALTEPAARPLHMVWQLVRQQGLAAPLAMLGAMTLAAGALVVEALLLRGLFHIANELHQDSQRLLAMLALLAFAALLLAFELPIMAESMRMGRQLETRLRMQLLAKLPRLSDRYFQSRSVGDMAERSHSLQQVRQLPSLVMASLQSGAEVLFTLLGVAIVAPASTGWAALIVLLALLLPWAMQPLLAERDMRLHNHAGALHTCFLDALLGLVPVRAHRAQAAVRRQHEGLLVAWTRACRSLALVQTLAGGLQSLLCMGVAGALLVQHFQASGAVAGSDLLLVYWVLKLPALGSRLGHTLKAWPGQRNVLARLMEPLGAPDAPTAAAGRPILAPEAGTSLRIEGGQVVAGGHTILQDLDLHIAAGEHVAIVGASGAGKSSLLGLLMGWHRLTAGQCTLNGHDASPEALAQLRRQVAWVDPGVQLWNRPLLDNLLYACPPTEAGSQGAEMTRLAAALDAADLRGVLQRLPQGLQTPLGEGGGLLSGGEGQRVRFARALMQDSVQLALLDEPFRGLDRQQRASLLQRARSAWAGATLLCVTHDVAETQGFDRVLVVEGGRIVEDGHPATLATQHSRYAQLLAEDQQVQADLWAGSHWRRLQVQAGQILATPVPGP
jgi:ABC-type bacteriocin/lantibiotic exporter with double-glycine peptidase domain